MLSNITHFLKKGCVLLSVDLRAYIQSQHRCRLNDNCANCCLTPCQPASVLYRKGAWCGGKTPLSVWAPTSLLQLPELARGMLTQQVVPSCPAYVRGCSCRWPPARFLVQRPWLGEICIGGQSLTAVMALLVCTEKEHLKAIVVCGALT